MHLRRGSRPIQPGTLLYTLCMLSVILAVIQACPVSAEELKIYSSEGVKKIEIPGPPADEGSASLPSYRYAGERCLSNCEAAPNATEVITTREKNTRKGPARPTGAPTARRICST